jgi:hypothetical protein
MWIGAGAKPPPNEAGHAVSPARGQHVAASGRDTISGRCPEYPVPASHGAVRLNRKVASPPVSTAATGLSTKT